MPTYEVQVSAGAGGVIEALEQLSDVLSVERIYGDPDHSFDPGEYVLDANEPTPSPEVNTIEIIECIDARADEHMIEDTGKTVAEHNPHYPNDDPVYAGRYPNMGDDRVWHFPESRLMNA